MIQVKKFLINCTILPFKPEILQKHLDYNPQRIQTARDKKLGEPGDMFYILGAGLYMLSFVAVPIDMKEYAIMYCDKEGFGTRGNGGYEELLKTLRTIYPDEKSVISHTLIKVNGASELLTMEK